ncbi:(2Fe-2S)-binding protein [Skermanella stibiiresistens SB22]|uniref:(2Fe-2S)-binding protein n=1 Tax=Skermanella stibiiresistens SB22 TaxID=1385369 RepID=W9H6W5_9PROT|nr:Rieske (2Fe-2S) protein [Skermanella stibiiresistens]EWY40521.1 (2Fe-2S)-binding protein [Skermanella stibiiresistens SB22]
MPEHGEPEPLCDLTEIPDGTGRGFTLRQSGGTEAPLDVVVVRQGDRAFGYVNSCPHARSPLDWTPDRFMSLDGQHIQCATHGALFQVEDGLCVQGPCVGRSLTPIPTRVEGGRVIVVPNRPRR